MSSRTVFSAAALFALSLVIGPAFGQAIELRNGATVEVTEGGTVNLEGSLLDLGATGASVSIRETAQGRFAGGRLRATRTLNSPTQADPAGLGVQLSASADLGATTIIRGHSTQTGNGNQSIERYYEIVPSKNNGGLSATLTFTYHDTELNGLSESNLAVFKSEDEGSTWLEEGQDDRNVDANTVTLDGLESFSRWTLGSENSPLPVELASFEGRLAASNAVELTWTTASETNSAGFEVQHRASEGANWSELGYVESKAEGGTSTESSTYRYRAADLPVGTHRFRLRQVDINGTATLSDPITVRIEMTDPVLLSAPAPNPVRGVATLSFAVKETQGTTLTLYNALGQRVATVYEGTPTPGESQTLQLGTTELASGVYFLRLRAGSHVRTRRLTVMR